MTAHVVEGRELSGLRARDQHVLARDVPREEVARFRSLLVAADAEPGAVEDALTLDLVDGEVVVVAAGKGRMDAQPRGRLRGQLFEHGEPPEVDIATFSEPGGRRQGRSGWQATAMRTYEVVVSVEPTGAVAGRELRRSGRRP